MSAPAWPKQSAAQPDQDQRLQIELDALQRRRVYDYRIINSEDMLGFKITVPFIQKVLALLGWEQDKWAEDQLRSRGFKPLRFTHALKVFDNSPTPVAFIIETYTYKRSALDDQVVKNKQQSTKGIE